MLEIAGTVQDFANAVRKVPGLEWLFEWEDEVEPDDDFSRDDDSGKPFSGRLFLLASNQAALQQLLGLWNQYQRDPDASFARGLGPFRHVFAHLRTIRHWDATDRVGADVRTYWQDAIDAGLQSVRFEIEAWVHTAAEKNELARLEIDGLVRTLGGRVLKQATIVEISYSGFLVELPIDGVRQILAGEQPALILSDRVMFFRPKGQSVADGIDEGELATSDAPAGSAEAAPVVALLDGLPLANHPLLSNRLTVDDPDGWSASYEAKDRVHGTAMASLLLHGELDGATPPTNRRVYARPILRPDPTDTFNERRREHTPSDELQIDLVHRAVKRICEGEAGQPAAAPSVRIVNLSVGDEARLFAREMSPWARLLDWLAFRYNLLIVVSAGNDRRPLSLPITVRAFEQATKEQRAEAALSALIADGLERRLICPSESMNSLTIGASHTDRSAAPTRADRFDLFAADGLSPFSRIGHGYRRSIKPDVLVSGGRTLHRLRPAAASDGAIVEQVATTMGPGQRTAMPPLPGGAPNTMGYCRGTSNAAALASRMAARAFDALEDLRLENAPTLPPIYDAVLLKALLVHGARWGGWPAKLLALRPEFGNIQNANTRRVAEKDYLARWLGHGFIDASQAFECTPQRATILGVGELAADKALVFSAPLPPTLAGQRLWRRLTITLAWMTPIHSGHQAYRRAKLWVAAPRATLRLKRVNSVHELAARRGTVQHEVLEGEDALAFVDGATFECKVNCSEDAGPFNAPVRFGLCVSLEVEIDTQIALYDEVRDRIRPRVQITPA